MLLSEGLELMIFGMGTVFVFLTTLVLVVTLMSRIIDRYFVVAVASAPVQETRAVEDDAVLAAVTAAVHAHRARRGHRAP